MGAFPEAYLTLPLEILSTAMREGQKLFSVVKGKKQLPFFLGVADAPGDPKGFIQKGNERVLKARLDDAKFFWEQDLKLNLSFMRLLEKVISVYGDKLKRPKNEILPLCQDFFLSRLRYIYEKMGFRYDLVLAGLSAGIDNINFSFLPSKPWRR